MINLRGNCIHRMQVERFDVLIIGAGINGAISAAALAKRGLKVAIVDSGDFGSGTSQESSNLIWGGIKYLESMELSLVHKLCQARNELIRAFPSSIREIRFLTTIDKNFRWSPSVLNLGTWFYWWMGECYTKAPEVLSKERIHQREALINTQNSSGGIEYSDALLIDNDARFVFNFVRSALDYGAAAANYVGVQKIQRNPEGHWIVDVKDSASGSIFQIQAKSLINAAGPYVDALNEQAHIKTEHRHLFSKGVHLMVRRLSDSSRVLTFFADDGRLFFVIPMGTVSCIGTTDTRVDDPRSGVTDEDRDFILNNINKRLQLDQALTRQDILAERCGVRPLVVARQSKVKDSTEWTSLSRKHAIDVNTELRMASIFGGKLTDCLNIGREILRIFAGWFAIKSPRSDDWYGEADAVIRQRFYDQAQAFGLDQMTAPESSEVLSTRLWRRYGIRAFTLLDEIRADLRNAEVLIKGTEYIRCELTHAARCEMVVHLEDFLRRRSKIALIAPPHNIRVAPGLQEACEILFGSQAEERIDEYFNKNQKS